MAQYYYIIYIQSDAQTYVLLIVHVGVFDVCRIPTVVTSNDYKGQSQSAPRFFSNGF